MRMIAAKIDTGEREDRPMKNSVRLTLGVETLVGDLLREATAT